MDQLVLVNEWSDPTYFASISTNQPPLPNGRGRIHAPASSMSLLFSKSFFIILCLLLIVISFVCSSFPCFLLLLFGETPSSSQHLDYVRMFPQIISIFYGITFFMIYDTNFSKMNADLDRHVLIRMKFLKMYRLKRLSLVIECGTRSFPDAWDRKWTWIWLLIIHSRSQTTVAARFASPPSSNLSAPSSASSTTSSSPISRT
jgi:hypothetical protein